MTNPMSVDNADAWDFYPCRVDDAPASIALDLRFRGEAPLQSHPVLYWVHIFMVDAGPHGMGSAPEADHLFLITDRIAAQVSTVGLHQVGRLRNKGCWSMIFYGAEGCEPALRAAVVHALRDRTFELGSKPDPTWDYYFSFLCPDDERWQWMQDRQVVDNLASHGDIHAISRVVDHRVYFTNTQDVEQFLVAVRAKDFLATPDVDDVLGEGSVLGVDVRRAEHIELEHIHGVVMQLIDLATSHGGEYDGWGTTVERGT